MKATKLTKIILKSLTSALALSILTNCGGGGGGSSSEADANSSTQEEGKAPLTLIPAAPQNAGGTLSTLTDAPASETPAPTGCTIHIPQFSDPDGNTCSLSFTCKATAAGEASGFITACELTLRDNSGNLITRTSSANEGEWYNNAYSIGDTMKDLYMCYEDTDSAHGFKAEVQISQLTVTQRQNDSSGNILRFSGTVNAARCNLVVNGVTTYPRQFSLTGAEIQVSYN